MAAPTLTDAERGHLLEVVDRRFGLRETDYGASRLEQALADVLPRTEFDNATELLQSLGDADNPRWLFELVEYLTVGETYFMRDPAQIAALRETILPDVVARRQAERQVSVWSAGCSTGEEVYTLAILLASIELAADWDITLVGTDVNRASLRIAREASFPEWSFRATPAEIRERYFEPTETRWRLKEPVRRMARFAWMNLAADPLFPPSTDLDLVVCRNVTIYFDADAAQRLYGALIKSLAVGGWLMLGPSDPLPDDRSRLERVEAAETVLWRRVAASRRAETPRAARSRRAQVVARSATVEPVGQVEPVEPIETVAAVAAIEGVKTPVSDPRAEMQAGLLALESGSFDAAVEWLRRATFRDPNSALAQLALGRALLARGDRPRARATLQHALRILQGVEPDSVVPGTEGAVTVEAAIAALERHLAEVAA